MTEPIKIVIADDHTVVRNGIRTLLEDEPDIDIAGEAANGLDVIERIKLHQPNIVIMDISMPKQNGLDTAAYIQKYHKNVRVILFTMHENTSYVIRAIESGVNAYLLKDCTREELVNAIRIAYEGEMFFNKLLTRELYDEIRAKPKSSKKWKGPYNISKQEKVILKYIVKGHNSREIAEILGLSVRTVDNHRNNIIKKTQAKNSAELVSMALRENLIMD